MDRHLSSHQPPLTNERTSIQKGYWDSALTWTSLGCWGYLQPQLFCFQSCYYTPWETRVQCSMAQVFRSLTARTLYKSWVELWEPGYSPALPCLWGEGGEMGDLFLSLSPSLSHCKSREKMKHTYLRRPSRSCENSTCSTSFLSCKFAFL